MSSPDRLRAAGLRRTPARQAVLDHVSALDRPVSHAELSGPGGLDGLDEITLYRTLATLETAGLLHRVQGPDGVRRYRDNPSTTDGCPGNHVHFFCTVCGASSCLFDQPMPKVRAPEGATIEGRQFLVSGRCAACST